MSESFAIPVALEVHNLLREAGAYERVKDWITRNKALNVLVLGSSGAGKTALVKSLRGENAYVSRTSGRSDRTESESGKLGEAPFVFHITPGEVLHEAKRAATIREMMGKDRIGIIDVVSYGYHEPDVDVSTAISGRGVRQSFLEERRQLEIDSLPSWTELLCGEGGPCQWIITVITKADLWWKPSDEKEVLDYYRLGPYKEALGPDVSSARVTHSVAPIASVYQPLFGKARMSGFYSDNLKARHHNELVSLMLRYASDNGK